MATSSNNSLLLVLLLLVVFLISSCGLNVDSFSIPEATIQDIQHAFKHNRLTSRKLVKFYLKQINILNPMLNGVTEVNPDALHQADIADRERRRAKGASSLPALHGIPILLKDNIGTKDKLNTSAGSYALLRSVVPRDAGVVRRLRKAGAIILGKASMTEWAGLRSLSVPNGWSAQGGQGKNPYVLSADPCGSSSGAAISVAANMVSVALGTETDGSILCPAFSNSVVGIKPTVGLTSRAGVIPISPRQDTIGPISRTVADAVYVLDAIVGSDAKDEATWNASQYIPSCGYKEFLNPHGLKGKRLGVVRDLFNLGQGSSLNDLFETILKNLSNHGAVLVDKLEIANLSDINNVTSSGEAIAMITELKESLNVYLNELVSSPVRSLADIIAFNEKFPDLEMTNQYYQNIFLAAEATNGTSDVLVQAAIANLQSLSENGFEKLMKEKKLDALLTPDALASNLLAIGGYPAITVPAGYGYDIPHGLCFGGLKGSEPTLIEIAYGFEQATKARKPPSFKP